jgi:hypothetical protein
VRTVFIWHRLESSGKNNEPSVSVEGVEMLHQRSAFYVRKDCLTCVVTYMLGPGFVVGPPTV